MIRPGQAPILVVDGVVPYWRSLGWQLDVDGDGVPDNQGGGTGTPGRSITSTAVVGGHLIVTYDDGSTQDAGVLPTAGGGSIARDTDGVPYVTGV